MIFLVHPINLSRQKRAPVNLKLEQGYLIPKKSLVLNTIKHKLSRSLAERTT